MKDIIYPFVLITSFFVTHKNEFINEHKSLKSNAKCHRSVVTPVTTKKDSVYYHRLPHPKNPRIIINAACFVFNDIDKSY